MNRNKGFSLLEMTFVLLALSFLLAGLLSPLSARMTQANIHQTDKQLQQAINALIGFAILQNRLPCPDSDGDGRENSASCDIEGDLPWADLGVNGKDVWNKTLRYRVQKNFTTTISATTFTCSVTSATCPFKIRRKDNTNLSVMMGDSNVVAVIFSSGKNRKFDGDNNNGDRTYTMDNFIENAVTPNDTFDDRITWLSKNELFLRMVTANSIYP